MGFLAYTVSLTKDLDLANLQALPEFSAIRQTVRYESGAGPKPNPLICGQHRRTQYL